MQAVGRPLGKLFPRNWKFLPRCFICLLEDFVFFRAVLGSQQNREEGTEASPGPVLSGSGGGGRTPVGHSLTLVGGGDRALLWACPSGKGSEVLRCIRAQCPRSVCGRAVQQGWRVLAQVDSSLSFLSGLPGRLLGTGRKVSSKGSRAAPPICLALVGLVPPGSWQVYPPEAEPAHTRGPWGFSCCAGSGQAVLSVRGVDCDVFCPLLLVQGLRALRFIAEYCGGRGSLNFSGCGPQRGL